jgi:antitoxin (DNA-binding transcriptional repressor) of toxin-antitoxin stability system
VPRKSIAITKFKRSPPWRRIAWAGQEYEITLHGKPYVLVTKPSEEISEIAIISAKISELPSMGSELIGRVAEGDLKAVTITSDGRKVMSIVPLEERQIE